MEKIMKKEKKNMEKKWKNVVCWECNEKGHYAKKCEMNTRRKRNECRYCGKFGHYMKECRERKKNEMMNREKAKILLEPILEKIQRK
jgi:hypothetical protein